MKDDRRPPGIQKAMKALRREAHERVVSRGLVQFRLEREYMQELLALADEKGLGYGVLARMWICEHLERERREKSSGLETNIPADRSIRKMIKEEVAQALQLLPAKKKRA